MLCLFGLVAKSTLQIYAKEDHLQHLVAAFSFHLMIHLFVRMSVKFDNPCFRHLIYEKVDKERGDTHCVGNHNQKTRYYKARSLLEFITTVSRGKV